MLIVPVCEQCGTLHNTRLVPAMTAYAWDGEGEDPNRPVRLCPECEEDYVAHWQERWDEYYSGLL